METMHAIAIEGGTGPAEALHLVERERPRPAAGQVAIRVRAAGVNYPDVLQRRGLYPLPPGSPETLGLEVAGEIAELGAGVTRWSAGDAVVALLPGGGYAECVVVDARHVLPLPGGLSMREGAGLPETIFTVWANVFDAGLLAAGETLLVHAGTSGIGATAIAMAKAAGARVLTTSRGAAKARQATELGADLSIDATAEDFAQAVRRAGGADVVLDMVGGDYTPKNLVALNPGGRLAQIATLAGPTVTVDLRIVMMKRLELTGSMLRPRSADEKARLARAIEERVWPWIAAGALRVPIDRVFPLARAADAHASLEANAHTGKIILDVE